MSVVYRRGCVFSVLEELWGTARAASQCCVYSVLEGLCL